MSLNSNIHWLNNAHKAGLVVASDSDSGTWLATRSFDYSVSR